MPDPDFYYARIDHVISEIVVATNALQLCEAEEEVDRIIYWAESLAAASNHLRYVALKYKEE